MLKRAFLIDDDAVFRYGLSRVLQEQFGTITVGSADAGRDETDAIRAANTDALFFNPPSDNPEAAGWLRRILAPPRDFVTVMLLGQPTSSLARELAALGLDGFLLKPIGLPQLSELVGAIRRNESVSSRQLSDKQLLPNSGVRNASGGLSERELLIIRRTADGRSSAQIAAEFGISIKTAERYRRAIFAKLGLHSVAELTKYAVRQGYTAL